MANMRNSKKPNCRAKARARRPAVAPEAGVGPHRTLDAATLEFRPALPSDAAACVDIRAQTRENAVSTERLASMGITAESWGDDIATGALRGHVCTLDGAIVAYCFGERDTGEVVVLALLPRFEQLGLGRTLLAQVIQDLTSFGHARLFLGCARDPSTRSHGFYRHLGWVSTGIIDSNDDEILQLFTLRAKPTTGAT